MLLLFFRIPVALTAASKTVSRRLDYALFCSAPCCSHTC